MDQINIVTPEGDLGSIPASEFQRYQQAGFRQATPEEVSQHFKEEEFGTPGQQAIATAEAAARGATFGLSTGLEKKLGVSPEAIRARQEVNPVASVIGEIGGIAGTAYLPGVGAANLMRVAGETGAAALGLGRAAQEAGLAAKVGSMAVKGAIETGMLQGGNEIHKMFVEDPNQTVQTAITDMGLASLMGGGIGAGLGVLSPLWKATKGSQLGQFLGMTQKVANGESVIASDLEAALQKSGMQVTPEIRAAFTKNPELERVFNVLRESQTTPGIDLKKALQDFHVSANESVLSSLGKKISDIPAIKASEFELGEKLQTKVADEIEKKFKPISEGFNEIRDKFKNIPLKQEQDVVADKLGLLAQEQGWNIPSLPQTKLVNEVLKDLPHVKTLEDLRKYQSNLWAKTEGNPQLFNAAGKINNVLRGVETNTLETLAVNKGPEYFDKLQLARKAYGDMSEIAQSLNERLHAGKYRGPESFAQNIREMTPEVLLNRLAKTNDAGLLNLVKSEFPAIYEDIKNHQLNKILYNASLKAPEGQALNLNQMFKEIDKLSPEYRKFLLGPAEEKISATRQLIEAIPEYKSSLTARHLDNLWGKLPGAATGLVAMLFGHNPAIGYALGQAAKWVARDMPDAIRLGFLRFLGKEGPVNPGAFKAAVDFAASVYKGEHVLNKTVNSIFKATSEIAPRFKLPSEQDKKKLDKMVKEYSADASKMLNVGGESSYYLEEHAPAMSETAARAVSYLSQLRPKTEKQGILEDERIPSEFEKAKYDRALTIAQQPLMVLEHIKNNTLTPDDIHAMVSIYPGLYQRMSDKIMSQIVEMEHEGKKLDYGTKMNLSMFLAQPLDSTFSQQNLAMNQTVENQAQTQQMPQGKGPRSYKALAKTAQPFYTSDQARTLNKTQKNIS